MLNISAFVICNPADIPNWWSISHDEAQAWADFQEWWTTAEPEIYRAAPEIIDLESMGYKCLQITFTGVIV